MRHGGTGALRCICIFYEHWAVYERYAIAFRYIAKNTSIINQLLLLIVLRCYQQQQQ